MDRLVRKRTSLVNMLCWKAEEGFDHLFWDCYYARAVWSSFFQEFSVNFVSFRSVRATIEEDIWGERNEWDFRGWERELSKMWSLTRLHFSFGLRFRSTFGIILLVAFYLVGPPYAGWVHECKQGTMDVASYFNKLSLIWQGWTSVERLAEIAPGEVWFEEDCTSATNLVTLSGIDSAAFNAKFSSSNSEKSNGSKKRATVARPRACTLCRECIRGDAWEKRVALRRVKDHFIFKIESTGALPPNVLFTEAVKILEDKCERLIAELS
ncbi:DNA-directed RNA polymerases I and III subunit RPAC1 [Cucumis melo var. makuwa]|uniref:DNA-directed RNA polymerases I and III subunit RPAC1 n=1 Tax=Cucumis melo var. makuwa TaxID=1194695 RepID=A0A5A7VJ83_CUCMM|nr:DNA-directed RNA polymerases I and III subunit RPAC1 [Cucumis melo var. makuwa]TYK13765.1 DNA-directed RNA polymerases I and III subunit RPAC1 [Cucumis melo var. makuwa]